MTAARRASMPVHGAAENLTSSVSIIRFFYCFIYFSSLCVFIERYHHACEIEYLESLSHSISIFMIDAGLFEWIMHQAG